MPAEISAIEGGAALQAGQVDGRVLIGPVRRPLQVGLGAAGEVAVQPGDADQLDGGLVVAGEDLPEVLPGVGEALFEVGGHGIYLGAGIGGGDGVDSFAMGQTIVIPTGSHT